MKVRYLVCLGLIAMSLISCKQNDWIDWKTQNELWLTNELPRIDSSYKTTPSGLRYRVIANPNPTEARPSKSSTIKCDYTLRLINGMVVNKYEESIFTLSDVVSGFAEGMTKINCHGDIILYVPCGLGYGSEAIGTEGTSSYVPPYSTLIFEIHLRNVTNL